MQGLDRKAVEKRGFDVKGLAPSALAAQTLAAESGTGERIGALEAIEPGREKRQEIGNEVSHEQD